MLNEVLSLVLTELCEIHILFLPARFNICGLKGFIRVLEMAKIMEH
jgi:hypothetical protein